MSETFVKYALKNNGSIAPLLIPHQDLIGPGLTNPSVIVIDNKIFVNLRNINYTLYHSEKKKYEHVWGPLVYIHPENELKLKTTNVFCELNEDLSIKSYTQIDTSKLDVEPLWEFVGLEDCRLIRWDEKLYLCGVRRDTTTNGQGRMELSELHIDGPNVSEISRARIPAPGENSSYCEKNWMPIRSEPYKFVKWSNPTEVVKVDINELTCESIHHGNHIPGYKDWRGGSQVISWGDYYVCLIHETNLFQSEAGRKDAIYRHRFVVWDKDWNLISFSKEFSFMNADIEFAVGMDLYKDDFLITFGYQDNAAYILKIPEIAVENFINE
jgi:hypothetical protein